MAVVGAHKIEALFKKAAGLQISKEKVKEVSDIVDQKFHDLLLIGEANAKYNGRDVIWYSDLPLTKAFRESMQKFRELEEELALQDVIEHLKTLPPLYTLEIELENKAGEIAGTLIYILAHIAKEFTKNDKVVSMDDLKSAERILNLTV
ncbi:MAG: hypothetical protein DSZ05_00455 [Sulfurospirillum sp.]|nr:MAG: hypothetical protein DSZ05_00455 [Sulfurospirillum sp.]